MNSLRPPTRFFYLMTPFILFSFFGWFWPSTSRADAESSPAIRFNFDDEILNEVVAICNYLKSPKFIGITFTDLICSSGAPVKGKTFYPWNFKILPVEDKSNYLRVVEFYRTLLTSEITQSAPSNNPVLSALKKDTNKFIYSLEKSTAQTAKDYETEKSPCPVNDFLIILAKEESTIPLPPPHAGQFNCANREFENLDEK